MRCPLSAKNIDVGAECEHSACWMNHNRAKNKCTISDVGTSHLVPADVAHIYGESLPDATNRIERGRAKLNAWLALLNALEEHKNTGCLKCGSPKCNGIKCAKRIERSTQLSSKLPFADFIEMTPAKRYVILCARASDNPAFSIQTRKVNQ
jgi:hypothetical protein